jgi:hypothetical protein
MVTLIGNIYQQMQNYGSETNALLVPRFSILLSPKSRVHLGKTTVTEIANKFADFSGISRIITIDNSLLLSSSAIKLLTSKTEKIDSLALSKLSHLWMWISPWSLYPAPDTYKGKAQYEIKWLKVKLKVSENETL